MTQKKKNLRKNKVYIAYTEMIKIHIEKISNYLGYAAENKPVGPTVVKIITRAYLTSDSPQFHKMTDHLGSILSENKILQDTVCRFLLVIHEDLTADLFVNDFVIELEIRTKGKINAGDLVMHSDIADIVRVKFPDIKILETDKIIFCTKIGWRFGLFFDLTPRSPSQTGITPFHSEKLDLDKMEKDIGFLYQYLNFYHVYKVLEAGTCFEEMLSDGWFPFIDILSDEYKELIAIYENKFDIEIRKRAVIEKFDKERIAQITGKWWGSTIFNMKKPILEAGINAYLENTDDGNINCIKNLWTEIEGILRASYLSEKGKGGNIKSHHLIKHIISKAKKKVGTDKTLFLHVPFLQYLEKVVFPSFDTESGRDELSRNTSSHGVAAAKQYTRERAIQLILVLDQIFFYI